jgi:hypothetical protein
MKKDDRISCVVKSNQTFDVMLHPRASFYLYQYGSIIAVRFPIAFDLIFMLEFI